jgi:hypothetical protein
VFEKLQYHGAESSIFLHVEGCGNRISIALKPLFLTTFPYIIRKNWFIPNPCTSIYFVHQTYLKTFIKLVINILPRGFILFLYLFITYHQKYQEDGHKRKAAI